MNIVQTKNYMRIFSVATAVLAPNRVFAHASEGGFVLLLPTNIYIFAGVSSVALTVIFLAILPDKPLSRLFHPLKFGGRVFSRLPLVTSFLSFCFLCWLIYVGITGPRDPLSNPLPLFIWTIWWAALVFLQGVLGDLWRWINPWSGPVAYVRRLLGIRPFLRFPTCFGYTGAVAIFLLFSSVLLADPAPSDPARLAGYVAGYWVFTFIAALVFGSRWMSRAEGISVFMGIYGRLGFFMRTGNTYAVGITGWQILQMRRPNIWLAIFIILMLGSGSFDGLNETFWWLDLLGLNPLEYPGRSAVIAQNIFGLVIANIGLILIFTLSVWLGLLLNRSEMRLSDAVCYFAPTILPIALGYHFAHYYTSFLVDGQYALAAATDPMSTGSDFLGLGDFYVTTGFFSSQHSVRLIWLTQAGAVVVGHIFAIILAHLIAVKQFGTNYNAVVTQAPLAIFMIIYTFFGLWLLASPRGF